MAGDAANTFVEVNTVVKVDKIWQVVHSGPDKRLSRAKTLPYRRQEGALSPDISMTVHTCFRGWEPSKSTHFYRGMTIAAVNTQSAHMVLVAELDWLLAHNPLFSGVAGPVQCCHEPQQSPKDKHRSQNADARDGVRARMKDLGHARWLTHLLGRCGPQPGHWAAAYRSRNRVQRRTSARRPGIPPCIMASPTCPGAIAGARQA